MRPIVLIPGIGGSILVQKGHENRKILHKTVPDNRWVNIYVGTSKGLTRWKRDMQCEYILDDEGKIRNIVPKIPNIYPYDFGGTKGVKDIIPEFLLLPHQYQNILEDMFHHRYYHFMADDLQKHGYRDNDSLLGAPYDFRFILDPSIRKEYFSRLRTQIENACHRHGNKAIVVTHSLGGIMFKWFATSVVSQEWIDDHIERWVCISTPFGGSNQALYASTSGEHYVPSMRYMVQSELQKHTGIIACMPNDLAFHPDEHLIVLAKGAPITPRDYYSLADEHDIIPFKIWQDLYSDHFHRSIKPIRRIPTHMICGLKRKSTLGHAYADSWDTPPYNYEMVDGDGVVPLKSLLCIEKISDRHQLIETMVTDEDHTSLLSNPEVIRIVRNYALKSHKTI
jgi:hypothetical protein